MNLKMNVFDHDSIQLTHLATRGSFIEKNTAKYHQISVCCSTKFDGSISLGGHRVLLVKRGDRR